MELVSQWQESYPKDNFGFMPATSNENQPLDEDNINDVQCVEQDDEDEVFSQLITTTNFFFCHQSEFQRHLLYRVSKLSKTGYTRLQTNQRDGNGSPNSLWQTSVSEK